MSKDEVNILIPKVRFPKFKKEGSWLLRPLKQIAKQITDKTGNRKYTLMSITSGEGLVTQIEKFGREIAGNSYKSYYVIKKNDFAYNKSSTKLYSEGEISMLEKHSEGAVPNSIFTCFRFDPTIILSVFAKYPFTNNIHGKWLKTFIAVGARANGALQINTKDLFTLPFPHPTLAEQQKIADCLSALDDLITAQNQKLEALKLHKKGLMQQLFPAEGETVPKLRFEEFRESGKWEEKSLGTVANIITGSTPSTQNSNYYGGNINFVSPADISESRYIYKTKTTLTASGFNLTRHIRANSVLFVCIGSTIGKIAQNKFECCTNQQLNSLVPSDGYSSDFLYSVLQYNAGRIALMAGIQAVPIINKSLFSSVLIFIPGFSEQKKIAECFLALDELLITQSEEIELLKLHKKAMMQQLFPTAF